MLAELEAEGNLIDCLAEAADRHTSGNGTSSGFRTSGTHRLGNGAGAAYTDAGRSAGYTG